MAALIQFGWRLGRCVCEAFSCHARQPVVSTLDRTAIVAGRSLATRYFFYRIKNTQLLSLSGHSCDKGHFENILVALNSEPLWGADYEPQMHTYQAPFAQAPTLDLGSFRLYKRCFSAARGGRAASVPGVFVRQLRSGEMGDKSTIPGNRFRRRFAEVPHSVFLDLVVLANEKMGFDKREWHKGWHVPPLELKVLCWLRIVGRGVGYDCAAEAMLIGEETASAHSFTNSRREGERYCTLCL